MTGGALTEKALALRVHEGQKRKDAPTPYLVHPVRVAILLARHGFPDEVVAAGFVDAYADMVEKLKALD